MISLISAMLVFLPHGLLGLLVASLAAAYMSTISTHLNWGASYVGRRCLPSLLNSPHASEEHYLSVARGVTIGLMVLACIVALWLKAAQAFHILLQIGAGTGLIFLLRWYWWRRCSKIAAMVISFLVAVYLHFGHTRLGFTLRMAPAALVGLGSSSQPSAGLASPSSRGRPIAQPFKLFTTASAQPL